MPRTARWRDALTLVLAVCSATVTGLVLIASGDGAAAVRPEIAQPKLHAMPAGIQLRTPVSLPTANLWVDPNSPAAKAMASLAAQRRSADASQLSKIASQPTATWLTNTTAASTVARAVAAAAASRQLPVFVTYFLPGRDCGGYSSGGATSNVQYQSWISGIVGQLGTSPAIVLVEPDAVAMAAARQCSAATSGAWHSLLAASVSALKRDPNARVYLDAGNSGWVANLSLLGAELKASGLAVANGFALNVSNFHTTVDSMSYGGRVSAAVGGAHFVIDTSRNGAGALPANSGYAGPSWCNPPGRALGTRPTTSTGAPLVDAYLWVKYPGASDGGCGLGDPAAGVFWPDYAIGLASRS